MVEVVSDASISARVLSLTSCIYLGRYFLVPLGGTTQGDTGAGSTPGGFATTGGDNKRRYNSGSQDPWKYIRQGPMRDSPAQQSKNDSEISLDFIEFRDLTRRELNTPSFRKPTRLTKSPAQSESLRLENRQTLYCPNSEWQSSPIKSFPTPRTHTNFYIASPTFLLSGPRASKSDI